MSLDGAFLHIVCNELQPLVGARVDKVYQPSREEIVVSLRTYRDGGKKIVLSANSVSARVNLTTATFENPQQPPMFCMLLRKHLSGGRLMAIRQDGLERIVSLDFECTNEIGDIVTNSLVAEIMGRHSNIILVRDGRVIDSVKRITDDISSVRRVLPGIRYEAPPRQDRLCLLDAEPQQVLDAIADSPERLCKKLSAVLEGVSPILTREMAWYSAKDVDAACNALSDSAKDRLRFILGRVKSAVSGGECCFTVVSEPGGRKKDFCFINIEQYSTSMVISHENSANELLDGFFASQDRTERTRQRAHDLLKLLMNSYERVSRKLELQKKELAECSEREVFRVRGDLINANIWRLEKGQSKAVLEDFTTGEPVEIQLDPRLTPAQNAQKYYTEYRKLDTAEKKLTELIAKGQQELVYIDSVFDAASRTDSESDLAEIRRELREQGYLKGGVRADEKVKKTSDPLHFRSSEGFEILVGRNNRQNDQLTLKTAKATDIWLHTQGIAGSHVIIRTEGRQPGEQTLFEAAQLAAFHSKGRSGSGVPVDYVAVKFVKKPAGAKPGMVIFTNNRTLYVTPDENLVNSLKANNAKA
ncbi:predicted RNA-binding protein homologous to eukaryotic snRNP [Eubacterium sp. CAG:786]|nr:predicted RNA-binding protein homologous to eukaryotic snRNP [Eubacterium sp. CAG:786]